LGPTSGRKGKQVIEGDPKRERQGAQGNKRIRRTISKKKHRNIRIPP